MNDSQNQKFKFPTEQQVIRDKCFHPSGTFVKFPKEDVEGSIPERFEKIVKLYPDRVAVKDQCQSLTYDELNQAANRVARKILKECGDNLSPILVFVDFDVRAIVSYLGALKAGKIACVVDSRSPIDRLTFMADDSRAEAMLAYGSNLKAATNLASRVRSVIDVEEIGANLSGADIGLRRSSQEPASIRYTSGSTGRPKGVIRSHRSDLFSYMLQINWFHICPEDRVMVLRALSFTPGDVFSGLMAGECVLPYDLKANGVRGVGQFLNTQQITHFSVTPSVFRYIVEDFHGEKELDHVRLIKFASEPFLRTDFELFKKHISPNCVILNRLSGKEVGAISQYWMTPKTMVDSPIVPVGYPIENKKIFILNGVQNEVETGEIGEIAVASRYLSHGYWNNTELTDQKFLPSNENCEERLYLTGDLGRRLPDGCLIYVGRKDDQIKIRGAKVEIGEVNTILSEHPQVKQSAVLAFDRENGENYLAAYIVSHLQPAPSVTDITDYLKKKLPDYMIPSAFMFLNSLPLTNGKLDRRVLPKPDNSRPDLRAFYVEPHSEVETKLAEIWSGVLGIKPIGIGDNFFELGGHSLTASQVVSRVVQAFKLELPIRALFDAPTVAEMAAVIEAHRSKFAGDSEMGRMLSEIETMTDEEAEAAVEQLDREGNS